MELADAIREAWTAVKESSVPEHMQELAFKEALRVTLGTSAAATAPVGNRPQGAHGRGPGSDSGAGAGPVTNGIGENDGTASVSENEVFQRVSAETTVPVSRLELLFHIDNGVVKLLGPVTKYGKNTTVQARNVAQIVTVVRKLGLGEADTSFEVVKEACISKHCYDSSNFASQHMKNMPSGYVIKGDGRNRRLEAKGPAIAAFPAVVDAVLES